MIETSGSMAAGQEVSNRRALRLLLIEDSEDDEIALLRELEREDYTVDVQRVQSADAMLQALISREWDVIIADYYLPRFGALAALQVIEETGIDLPFIVVSGMVEEDMMVQAMKAGAHDYVYKNNLRRLVPAIERERKEARGRAARRAAEQSRRRSEADFRKLMDHVADGIVTVDKHCVVASFNPAAERLFGYAQDDVVGVPLESFLLGFQKTFSDPAVPPKPVEGVGIHRGGSQFPVEMLASGTTIGEERRAIISVRDVSERKRAELALRRSHQRLMKVQETVRREIAQQLHGRVQGRLQALRWRLREAVSGSPCPGPVSDTVNEVIQQLEDVTQNELSVLSRRLYPAILRRGLTAALESLGDSFEPALLVDVLVDEDFRQSEERTPDFVSEPLRIAAYRTVEEALGNVLKHAETNRAEVRLGFDHPHSIRLVVEDNGRGFDIVHASEGLGLTTMHDYIAAIGGTLVTGSAPGHGTRISVTLPLSKRV